MAKIVQFPGEKVYPNLVKGEEIHRQPEPTEEMVWAVCPWLRAHQDDSRCRHCPAWFEEPNYGTMRYGCYGMAAETCKVIFAMQARASQTVTSEERSLPESDMTSLASGKPMIPESRES